MGYPKTCQFHCLELHPQHSCQAPAPAATGSSRSCSAGTTWPGRSAGRGAGHRHHSRPAARPAPPPPAPLSGRARRGGDARARRPARTRSRGGFPGNAGRQRARASRLSHSPHGGKRPAACPLAWARKRGGAVDITSIQTPSPLRNSPNPASFQ